MTLPAFTEGLRLNKNVIDKSGYEKIYSCLYLKRHIKRILTQWRIMMPLQKSLYAYVCRSLAFFKLLGFVLILISSSEAADGMIAQVGGTVITESDLQQALEQYMPAGTFHAGIDRSAKPEYRKAALDDLIERELLSREADKREIKVQDETVEAVFQFNIKRFGTEQKLSKALVSQGLTIEMLRQKIRKFEMVNILLKNLAAESRPSDEEVKKHYEENRSKYRKPDSLFVYHILIKVEPTASDEVWRERQGHAEQLLEKIRSGADFGNIAYEYSEDPYKYKSGALGFIHRGRLTPQELEDAAFGLKKDEVSNVLRTIHGFHILKAGETKAGETKTFDEMKDRLKKDMEKDRFEGKKRALLEQLRKEYPVTISPSIHGMPDGK